jgi:hypothetical protein
MDDTVLNALQFNEVFKKEELIEIYDYIYPINLKLKKDNIRSFANHILFKKLYINKQWKVYLEPTNQYKIYKFYFINYLLGDIENYINNKKNRLQKYYSEHEIHIYLKFDLENKYPTTEPFKKLLNGCYYITDNRRLGRKLTNEEYSIIFPF